MKVGRDPKSDLIIKNTKVSSTHCVISNDGILDNSTNGTFVFARTVEEFINKVGS